MEDLDLRNLKKDELREVAEQRGQELRNLENAYRMLEDDSNRLRKDNNEILDQIDSLRTHFKNAELWEMFPQYEIGRRFIYVLKLNDDEAGVNKYYVGQTSDLRQRLASHFLGKSDEGYSAAKWSKIYAPKYVFRIYEFQRDQEEWLDIDYWESKITIELMQKYDYRNVRGGKFVSVDEGKLVHYLCKESNINEFNYSPESIGITEDVREKFKYQKYDLETIKEFLTEEDEHFYGYNSFISSNCQYFVMAFVDDENSDGLIICRKKRDSLKSLISVVNDTLSNRLKLNRKNYSTESFKRAVMLRMINEPVDEIERVRLIMNDRHLRHVYFDNDTWSEFKLSERFD